MASKYAAEALELAAVTESVAALLSNYPQHMRGAVLVALTATWLSKYPPDERSRQFGRFVAEMLKIMTDEKEAVH